MPMHLGSDRVKGMYLDGNTYNGLALGATPAYTFDYGVDVYAMPPNGTTDEANWTLNQGLGTKGNNGSGAMWFQQNGLVGPNVQSPTYTTVVGRVYESIVSRQTGGYNADPDVWAHQVWEGGVAGDVDLSLDQGDVSIIKFTAVATTVYIQLFSFFPEAAGERLWIDEVYFKEVG